MQETFDYIDSIHPAIHLCIFASLYLIARYVGKRHLKKQNNGLD
jgi:hypothetical protein